MVVSSRRGTRIAEVGGEREEEVNEEMLLKRLAGVRGCSSSEDKAWPRERAVDVTLTLAVGSGCGVGGLLEAVIPDGEPGWIEECRGSVSGRATWGDAACREVRS